MAWIALVNLVCVSAAAGTMDLFFRRVPNAILILGLTVQIALVVAIPQHAVGAPLASSAPSAVVGLVLGFAVFLPLWRFGAMGAGDVKFLAVLGFCLGPLGLFFSWLLASLLAGAHAVVVVFGRALAQSSVGIWWQSRTHGAASAIGQRLAPARAWMMARRGSRKGTPYATYLAIGALLWVFVLYDQYQ